MSRKTKSITHLGLLAHKRKANMGGDRAIQGVKSKKNFLVIATLGLKTLKEGKPWRGNNPREPHDSLDPSVS